MLVLTQRFEVESQSFPRHPPREHVNMKQTAPGLAQRYMAAVRKHRARLGAAGLKNQIASARKLVLDSIRSVRRSARELDFQQPEPGGRPVAEI